MFSISTGDPLYAAFIGLAVVAVPALIMSTAWAAATAGGVVVAALAIGGATGAGPATTPWLVARAGAQVTWPDGSPAGTADGTFAFLASDASARGDRLCITRTPIATPICHRATDVAPALRW